MEPPKIFGAAEECQSSESGWTMYIGSPTHGEDFDAYDHSDQNGDDDDDDDQEHNYKNSVNQKEDSDDSMASDASSGPSHRMADYKHQEDDHKNNGKHKKAKNPVGKNRNEKKKEESLFTTTSLPIRSGDKVRKNNLFGKRK